MDDINPPRQNTHSSTYSIRHKPSDEAPFCEGWQVYISSGHLSHLLYIQMQYTSTIAYINTENTGKHTQRNTNTNDAMCMQVQLLHMNPVPDKQDVVIKIVHRT